jgi:SPOR domain
LLIALFSSRDDASEQRAAIVHPVTVIAKTATAPVSYSVESDGTRGAPHTVRDLTDDLTRITTRLAAVERSIDDLTNTVMQQSQTTKDGSAKALPAWTNDEAVTSSVAPAPASNAVSPVEARLSSPPNISAPADAQPDGATVSSPAYGADIGSATSMKALNTRWAEIRSAHEEIFENLRPVAAVKDNPRTNRVELRLVIGSFANRAEAAKLCTSLATFHIGCQPVMLDGQQIALQ